MNRRKFNSLISKSLSRNPKTDRELCLYNPTDTLRALKTNKKIKNWHNYIINQYTPPKKRILLFFPCAAYKPWTEGKTRSQNYKMLYSLLRKKEIKNEIALHTVSEPLALIGENDYETMPLYDNPGLFKWFTRKNGLKWDQKAFEKSVEYLGKLLAKFLKKHQEKYEKVLAFVKPNSSHQLMMKFAKRFSNLDIQIAPKRSDYAKLRNNYVWLANENIRKLLINNLNI